MISNLTTTVSSWKAQAPQGGAYTEKIERLERDLVTLSDRTGTLQETDNGFKLHILRGTPGGPVFPQSVTDYTVDLKQNTVQVRDLNPVVVGPSYCSSPGGQATYTLDVDARTLTNLQRGPVPAGTPHVSWGGPYREI